ncbi:MAG: hypothetical protein AB7V08_14675 [Elusimicrobiales bacterium]
MQAPDEVELRDCFRTAVDASVYLAVVRDKAAVLGSSYVPKAVRAVGEKAANGDVAAARLLFELVGIRDKVPAAQVTAELNINVPRLRDIITIDEEGRIVDAEDG